MIQIVDSLYEQNDIEKAIKTLETFIYNDIRSDEELNIKLNGLQPEKKEIDERKIRIALSNDTYLCVFF